MVRLEYLHIPSSPLSSETEEGILDRCCGTAAEADRCTVAERQFGYWNNKSLHKRNYKLLLVNKTTFTLVKTRADSKDKVALYLLPTSFKHFLVMRASTCTYNQRPARGNPQTHPVFGFVIITWPINPSRSGFIDSPQFWIVDCL